MADKKVVHQDVDDYGVELIENKAGTQAQPKEVVKPKEKTAQTKAEVDDYGVELIPKTEG